jgi:hypothetical protein
MNKIMDASTIYLYCLNCRNKKDVEDTEKVFLEKYKPLPTLSCNVCNSELEVMSLR